MSWSPDGTKIAFGCADNTLRAIDAATGKQLLFQGAHSDWVLGTIFSQDSQHIVSISRDMSMKLTEVATQRFVDNVTSITPGGLKGGLLAVDRRPQKSVTKVKGVDGRDKIYDEVIIGGSDGVPRLYKIHRVVQRVIGDDANKVREFASIARADLRSPLQQGRQPFRRRQQPRRQGRGPRLPDQRRQGGLEVRPPPPSTPSPSAPTANRSPPPASTAPSASATP